jgi:phosphoesterase RecJ-like protein
VKGSPLDVAAALADRHTFILTSHARPDGDAVGSSLALGLALQRLGKQARVILKDPVPAPYAGLPGIGAIERADRVTSPADAVVLLECSEIARPEIAGLDSYFVINIDHHLGNAMYGAVNWFDPSAAACAELVAELIDRLGVSWTPEIATYLYLGISTDTGGFRYGPLSARTYELCRRIAECGVDTAALARTIFDSYSVGRIRLTGALLDGMELHHQNRLALLSFDDDLLARCGATIDDTEGLVNIPLGARDVLAVALFKRQADSSYRLSLRSKGAVDVRGVASRWHGGGHHNAAGCTVTGELASIRSEVIAAMGEAIASAAADPVPANTGPAASAGARRRG